MEVKSKRRVEKKRVHEVVFLKVNFPFLCSNDFTMEKKKHLNTEKKKNCFQQKIESYCIKFLHIFHVINLKVEHLEHSFSSLYGWVVNKQRKERSGNINIQLDFYNVTPSTSHVE